jgi:hypothetical protein
MPSGAPAWQLPFDVSMMRAEIFWGARLIRQQVLEDEVTEFLERVRYEGADEPVSYRNGYEPRRVVTTAGPVELERLRVPNESPVLTLWGRPPDAVSARRAP